jgi:hypothetical protein
VVERGLAPYLLREIDLVVFPRHVDGERYVGEVVELLDEAEYERLDDQDRCGVITKGDTEVYWNTVAWRTHDGEFGFAYRDEVLGDDDRVVGLTTFDRIAAATDRSTEAVVDEYHAKYRYVRYLVSEGVADVGTLFDLLADLEANEAATVERLQRRTGPVSTARGPSADAGGTRNAVDN